MSMQEYPAWDIRIPTEKLKEVAPVSYAKLYNFMEENGLCADALWYLERGDADFIDSGDCEHDDCIKEFQDLVTEFVLDVEAATGVTIYASMVPDDSGVLSAGDVFWAADLQLSDELKKLDAYIETWTEFG